MIAVELVRKNLGKLSGVEVREDFVIVTHPVNDRSEIAFQDRQPSAKKSPQSRGKGMEPGCIQFAILVQFFRESVYERQLPKFSHNLQRQYIPPIDSPVVRQVARSKLQEFPRDS